MNNTIFTTNSNSFSAIRQTPAFSKVARNLRGRYEAVFSNPLQAKRERFCWDYWNVPNQYRLLRTPAESFFGDDGKNLMSELAHYGRTHLGCQMISHPWMSVYLDGHFQNLHSDVPHGPWSFVYSLTPYSRTEWAARPFRGGETLIAKPKLLRYFRELKSDESDEQSQLFQLMPQPFNQLTVFDPRYPHGVSRVEGADDLLNGRVVIHGWFTEPRPMIEGPLATKKASKGMDFIANHLIHHLQPTRYSGLLSLRLNIAASGRLTKIETLAAHLTDPMGDVITPAQLKRILKPVLENPYEFFPKSARTGNTRITLPIEFKA